MKMAIQITNLKFSYTPTSPTILDIPSWQLEQGEPVFLQGPSGCGKSSLLNLISGVLPISEGQMTVLDTPLDTLSSRQRDRFRAQHIGYVFQRFNLIPYLSALDNVRLACAFTAQAFDNKDIESRAQSLLDSLGIEQAHWQQPSSELSVGQQQRVAIARAMIHQPKLLIVDEPTSSLDQANRDAFIELLLRQVESTNLTLLFVSHDQTLSSFFSHSQSMKEINHA